MSSTTKANRSILLSNSDILKGLIIFSLLLLVALPLPVLLLDVLLSFCLAFSLVILLAAYLIKEPIEFSSFPILQIVLTFTRLSLIIASIKIILLHGNEGLLAGGKVIQFFGTLVIANNSVVGFLITFSIFTGIYFYNRFASTRISQLSDQILSENIPNKLKAISSEVRSKNISINDAKSLNKKLLLETELFKSLNSSFKYSRLDFTAGLILSILCFFVGAGVGIIDLDMNILEAAKIYGILAVGSSLVYFLSGLLLMIAGEKLLSHSQSAKQSHSSFVDQLSNVPEAFIFVSVGFFILAIIPGSPHFPFLLMSTIAAAVGFVKIREKKEKENLTIKSGVKKDFISPSVKLESLLPLEMIELLVGSELINLTDQNKNIVLVERIKKIRQKYALEMGFVIPKIPIRIGNKLKPNEYSLLIKGESICRGEAYPELMLATSKGEMKSQLEGIEIVDPISKKPGLWISPSLKDIAVTEGLSLLDLPSVISSNIDAAIRLNGKELLGTQEVSNLLENFSENNPKIVEELIPGLLTLGRVKKVLQNLVAEQVSIRDLRTILDKLADLSRNTADTNLLTEKVRAVLSRTISKNLQNNDGTISVLEFDRNTEESISNGLEDIDETPTLVFEPEISEKLLNNIEETIQAVSQNFEGPPIILTSPLIRRSLKNFTLPYLPELSIVSYDEIIPTIQINTLKVISLDEN
ncbi:MAG: FHIPEP family type III secretion protein [Nitrospinales bacterium]